MSQKRNMPTKKAILQHWENKYQMELYDNYCWACGQISTTERCHLKARLLGGPDEVDNLVLLCHFCHQIQESWFSNERSEEFRKRLIEYPPFFKVRFDYFMSLIKYEIVDLSRLNLSQEQITQIKQQMTVL
jgi:5-methylcytosine-specific restriction endonuclease McrA